MHLKDALRALGFSDEAAYAAFDRTDQASIRADLAAYCGPRPEAYLRGYENMRRSRGRTIVWNWPGLVAPLIWIFYRKAYLLGATSLLSAVPMFLVVYFAQRHSGTDILKPAALAFSSTMPLSLIQATTQGRVFYLYGALCRIAKADRLGLVGEARHDYLRRAGGVSVAGGVLGALLFAGGVVVSMIWIGDWTFVLLFWGSLAVGPASGLLLTEVGKRRPVVAAILAFLLSAACILLMVRTTLFGVAGPLFLVSAVGVWFGSSLSSGSRWWLTAFPPVASLPPRDETDD